MTEYIEKEAARPDEFCVGVSCQECPFLKDPLYGGCRVDDFIMAIPPADVQPVIHGHWIPVTNGRGGHECSVCHNYAPSYQAGNEYLSRFCPACGSENNGPNQ